VKNDWPAATLPSDIWGSKKQPTTKLTQMGKPMSALRSDAEANGLVMLQTSSGAPDRNG